ncbi:hypothetical protein AGOR_G00006150 [Albula goreensis]|uniref:Protein KTI12 homolog n=1 Tax=Albula goreensis TaxID=1534307 RepID=A0A8T3EBB1_9TELE|nr:hypothetical protein AGOR_G00006150 [Albula goreensis]
MAGITLNRVYHLGLLSYFLLFSYISVTTSVSLDLTELRNKVAKIKVNPRGNLWATGHFMGKKSVVDSSLLESAGEPAMNAVQVGLNTEQHAQDLRELISQEVLKIALEAKLQDTWGKQDSNDQWEKPKSRGIKGIFLKSTDRKVIVVGDETVGIDKNSVYADSQKEKNLRGSLRAEVERMVNKDDIVILDSLNYIKGYRYELFCLIKHAQTPHCLVYCVTSAEVSSTWNSSREADGQYTQEIFDALVMRFEAPDSRNRWDSPLFAIQKDDTLPFDAIADAIFHRKAPPPNQSTQSQPLSSTNFLYELDKVTQDVLTAVLNSQKTSVPGDLIAVPGAMEKISFKHFV